MSDYSVHIVIDNGGSTTKAGFNGENAPRVVIPTVTGKSKNEFINLIEENSKVYVGREAINNYSYLNLSHPIKNGVIDVEKMEKVWAHIFTNELKIKPEAHNVFLTESLYSSNAEREKVAEVMFEKFSIFNIHIEPQQVMTLYSTTKTSGLIIESGEGTTDIVPIYEGYIIPQGIKSNNIAGELMTVNFLDRIKDQLIAHNVCNHFEMAKRVKEKYSEVSLDDSFIKNVNLEIDRLNLGGNIGSTSQTDNNFQLPDGNSIIVGGEKSLVPEIIFQPDLIGSDALSIQSLVSESVKNVDIHLRKEFLSNIIFGGGNTMIKNFPDRLKKELNQQFDKDGEGGIVKINAQNERVYSSWIGASVVCSISNFQQMWISKNDYEEIGPNIIHKKYSY